MDARIAGLGPAVCGAEFYNRPDAAAVTRSGSHTSSGRTSPFVRVHLRDIETLVAAAARIWRPAPDVGLPTGAAKAQWLGECIADVWEELDHPCSERAVEYALACAASRGEAHRDETAVVVHGDVHQRNALEAGDGFKLVDPDGLADREYDLGSRRASVDWTPRDTRWSPPSAHQMRVAADRRAVQR